MLTVLRLANIAIWTGLLIYMLPSAKQAVSGKEVRRADPMRLSVASVCLLIILGNLRWLFAPDNEMLLGAVSVLSIIVGMFKIVLSRAYGRGPRL